jgi:hypothetical protein
MIYLTILLSILMFLALSCLAYLLKMVLGYWKTSQDQNKILLEQVIASQTSSGAELLRQQTSSITELGKQQGDLVTKVLLGQVPGVTPDQMQEILQQTMSEKPLSPEDEFKLLPASAQEAIRREQEEQEMYRRMEAGEPPLLSPQGVPLVDPGMIPNVTSNGSVTISRETT